MASELPTIPALTAFLTKAVREKIAHDIAEQLVAEFRAKVTPEAKKMAEALTVKYIEQVRSMTAFSDEMHVLLHWDDEQGQGNKRG